VSCIFINRFYWPDEPATAQILTDLAESLAAKGHDVVVITSRSRSTEPEALGAMHRGVSIDRIRSTRLGRRNLFGRAWDFATFLVLALWRLFRRARHGDIVVVMTDPPLLGLFAWPVARFRGAQIVHWVQDIYPEIALRLTGHWWLHALRPWRNLAWRRADACVVLGTDMGLVLTGAGVAIDRIHVVPNWSPRDLTPPDPTELAAQRAAWKLTEKFVVAYSGNLGRVHDLDPILEVATAMRGDSRFAFVFIGDGAQRATLEETVRTRKLGNVHFFAAQSRARLAATLSVGHVHFVTLRDGCERLVFPSKLYGIAAVGRPVIFVGPRDCEIARLIEAHGIGMNFTRGETAEIVSVLIALHDDAKRRAALGFNALAFAGDGWPESSTCWDALLAVVASVEDDD
jgi:glycosyltransferase involved in cell wall biosynthesis